MKRPPSVNQEAGSRQTPNPRPPHLRLPRLQLGGHLSFVSCPVRGVLLWQLQRTETPPSSCTPQRLDPASPSEQRGLWFPGNFQPRTATPGRPEGGLQPFPPRHPSGESAGPSVRPSVHLLLSARTASPSLPSGFLASASPHACGGAACVLPNSHLLGAWCCGLVWKWGSLHS